MQASGLEGREEMPLLLDHPVNHPDDPTGPVGIRPDRRGIQREQARSVWSRPDRRRAPGYGSGGWGFGSLAARQRPRSVASVWRPAMTATRGSPTGARAIVGG